MYFQPHHQPPFIHSARRPAWLNPLRLASLLRIIGMLASLALPLALLSAEPPPLEPVRVAPDQRGFVLHPSGRPFQPWGFNYDHDDRGRLLEDYWHAEWPTVAEDFQEMKELGANVVRVHLQLGRFMTTEHEPDRAQLAQFQKLVRLAETTGLRLDVTGLGCYHKRDVPAWYDTLSEPRRWAVQARFWEAVARAGRGSPAIFCYDLMNEPVAPAGPPASDWLGPAFAGKHFVQRISLDLAGRPRTAVAQAWIRQLTRAIRTVDPATPITVGLVPWSLDRPGLTSGFEPKAIVPDLDFISVHLYPEAGKIVEELATLRGFAFGKPVVIEETFPLKCSGPEFARFLTESRAVASGWVGFYWGKTLAECRQSKTIADALMAGWLEVFQRERPAK
ncbi:hypothetical protein LBMAG56_09920 [Verrucomicrobiota bacterium]|nr:hypothetical protein LBMAG56_09920 [Verrucomicrobiota bacterium]